jgi:hypothetical protein
MIGDLFRLAVGEAGTHVRGWVTAAVLGLLTAACLAVAIGLGTAAAFAALSPELGTAWTAALLAAVYLALGLVAMAGNKMARRRQIERQIAYSRARAAATPAMSPEMMLLAAAAGALFTLGSGRRSR